MCPKTVDGGWPAAISLWSSPYAGVEAGRNKTWKSVEREASGMGYERDKGDVEEYGLCSRPRGSREEERI